MERKLRPLLPNVPAPKSRQPNWPEKQFKKNGEPTVYALKYYGEPHLKYRHDRISKMEEMNLRNSDHVRDFLFTQGWIPTEWNFKKEGRTKVRTSPKLTEDSFDSIEGHTGQRIALLRKLWSRQGVLEGWQEAMRPDGTLPTPIGGKAVTHRLRHSVVVNIPRVSSFFGQEVRELFIARPGRVIVGCDSGACQMRMLCHELLSKGFNADLLVRGLEPGVDPHEENKQGINEIVGEEVVDRIESKTVFYAVVFGSAAKGLATTMGIPVHIAEKILEAFYTMVPGLAELKEYLKAEIRQKGYVRAIDGRPLYIRSPHMATVSLMQGDEAAAMEMSMVWAENKIRREELDADQLIYYHDELDWEARAEHAVQVGEILAEGIRWPGEYLGLRIPLTGDAQIGETWADVH